MQLWFGKFRGYELENVPADYLCWMIDNMERESLRQLAQDELNRRAEERRRLSKDHSLTNLNDAAKEFILAGYKALVQKHHPDHGGDLRRMQEINAAMDELRKRFG